MKSKAMMFMALLLIGITSCEKKKKYETSVSGIVKEKNGTRIIADAKVYLLRLYDGPYSNSGEKIDSAVTGKDGQYKFTFNEGHERFRVVGYAENYYTNGEGGEANVEVGDNQSLNLELWPHAWLKVNFLNQSGANGINVNRFYGEIFGYQIYNQNDATVIGQVKGNSINDVNYFVYPEGKALQESIYCPGLDTTFLQIIY